MHSYQYLICVRTLYLCHTKPISKSNPKPHCTGSTLSFWYKHVDCPLKEGCWVCLIKDHRPDYGEDTRNVLCIVDSRVYLVYAEECGDSDAHKGVFDFKTDLGVSGVFLCLVCPVLFCLPCVTDVWYPCPSVTRATLTCAHGAGRRRVLTFACACLYTAWHKHDTSTHTSHTPHLHTLGIADKFTPAQSKDRIWRHVALQVDEVSNTARVFLDGVQAIETRLCTEVSWLFPDGAVVGTNFFKALEGETDKRYPSSLSTQLSTNLCPKT